MNMDSKFLIPLMEKSVKEYMNTEVSGLKAIGGGSFGVVYKGILTDGSPIAIKAFRIKGWNEKESKQLKALSKSTSVKLPEVYFTHSDCDAEIMGMSFMNGKNALDPTYLFKNKTQKDAFTNSVVDGLMEIHSTVGTGYGDILNPTYSTWLDFFHTEKIEPGLKGLNELCQKGKYSKKNYEKLCNATELFYKLYEEPEHPVLIHGDINIMNIMVDPKTMALEGFIDPGSVAWADREYELFQLRNMWGDNYKLYETYKSKFKTSKYCDFKVAYYGALNEASCRLAGGLIFPIWEMLCNKNLHIAMKQFG